MKKIIFMAIVATYLLACNKQDATDPENLGGESVVTLSIQQTASTKGVSDQKGDTEYAVIGSGKLYFLDASSNYISQRELTATEITTLANLPTSAGGGQVAITGVPSTATKLYFVANIKTSAGTTFPQTDGPTGSDSRLRIDKLQANALNVPMAGLSTDFSPATGSQRTTSVVLTPLVARIELGQVTVQDANPTTTSDIKGYKLSGVFVNNIHQAVLLGGTPYLVGSPINITSQAGWGMDWTPYFTSANTVFPYHVGGTPPAPGDWVANSMITYCTPQGAAALSFYPNLTFGSTSTDPGVTPKLAWGYQVVPSTTFVVGQTADVPHIILKLTEVTYRDNPLGATTKYVTVTKYKNADNSAVVEFKRGNVYRIQNLTFTHNEATNQPYEKNITVTATVTVASWVINSINPDWN